MVEDIITPIAGQVTTVAGMGIGLGILAGTASNVMAAQRQMMGVKQEPIRQQRMQRRHKTYKMKKGKYHPRHYEEERPRSRYPNMYKPIRW